MIGDRSNAFNIPASQRNCQKRIFYFLVASVLLLTAVITATATCEETDGAYVVDEGELKNGSWTYTSDGTLTISGNGHVWLKPEQYNVPYWDYVDSITTLSLSEGVDYIEYQLYMDLEVDTIIADNEEILHDWFWHSLCPTKIVIGESVRKIDNFYSYSEKGGPEIPNENSILIKEVILPRYLESITDSFTWMGISDIDIPDTVTTISNSFNHCENLLSVSIPDPCAECDSSFNYCTSLRDVDIGRYCGNVDRAYLLGETCFDYCPSLERFTVDPMNTVYFDSDGTLYHLEKQDYIILDKYPAMKKDKIFTIPKDVKRIDDRKLCRYLEEINVEEGNERFYSEDGVLFHKTWEDGVPVNELEWYPAAKVGPYTIPDNVSVLGDNAFSACTYLIQVTIPSTVTISRAYDAPFLGCDSIISVTNKSKLTEEELGITKIPPFACDISWFALGELIKSETSMSDSPFAFPEVPVKPSEYGLDYTFNEWSVTVSVEINGISRTLQYSIPAEDTSDWRILGDTTLNAVYTLVIPSEGDSKTLTPEEINEIIEDMDGNDDIGVEVDLPQGTVSLDSDAVMSLEPSKGIEVTLAESPVSVPSVVKEKIGNQKSFNLSLGDIKTLVAGSITVTVPYKLDTSNSSGATVYLVDNDTLVDKKDGQYKDGNVSFETDSISPFIIGQIENGGGESSDNQIPIIPIIIALIVIGAIVCLILVVRTRKSKKNSE